MACIYTKISEYLNERGGVDRRSGIWELRKWREKGVNVHKVKMIFLQSVSFIRITRMCPENS